jgi:hypothetical protein
VIKGWDLGILGEGDMPAMKVRAAPRRRTTTRTVALTQHPKPT